MTHTTHTTHTRPVHNSRHIYLFSPTSLSSFSSVLTCSSESPQHRPRRSTEISVIKCKSIKKTLSSPVKPFTPVPHVSPPTSPLLPPPLTPPKLVSVFTAASPRLLEPLKKRTMGEGRGKGVEGKGIEEREGEERGGEGRGGDGREDERKEYMV